MSGRPYTQADVERIARACGKAKRTGDEFSCLCPAHDDKNPSCTIGVGDEGKLLVHCHTGCKQAEVWQALQKRGLLLNGDARPAEPKREARKKIVAVYRYTDERGQVLYEKVRYEPKGFVQRLPDGTYKLGNVRRVLYRQPELATADEVILVEGEKDVENLRKLGFTATTNVEGASKDTQKPKWRKEYSATLAGKNLVFIPDNDAAGQAHMENAARSCHAAGAASVRIVQLEGLPEKGDVSDWLKARHTADELRGLIAKAPEWQPDVAADDWRSQLAAAVDELNRKHFVVPLGGKTVICSFVTDDILQRERLVFSGQRDIELLYSNRHYITDFTGKKPITKELGHLWLKHEHRRSYERIAFLPKGETPEGAFNLWKGFGVEPKRGLWPTIRQHLLEVICDDNSENLLYLLCWFAYCVQYPERPAEVAVVMRGPKGCGKGMVGRLFLRIFRNHGLHITNSRHLVGNFNSHLVNCLAIFIDEAFLAGDKHAEGVLKGIITEPTLMIEPKGFEPFLVPNMLKPLIASNHDWVIPVTADERRFFQLDVSAARAGDRDYFAHLNAAIEGDEAAAFLQYLLDIDLSNVDIRSVPHTKGLNRQKMLSLGSIDAFWADCLRLGEIIGAPETSWPTAIGTQVLHGFYLDHARDHGERKPDNATAMMLRFKEHLWKGCLVAHKRLPATKENPNRPRGYVLATLAEHRAAFLKALRISAEDAGFDPESDDAT